MNNDLISISEVKSMGATCLAKRNENGQLEAVISLDDAPTVEITEEQAIDKLHETGWLIRHDKEMTDRPHGKWNYIQSGMCVCPFCGAMPHKLYKNFCAKCGADMREDSDE